MTAHRASHPQLARQVTLVLLVKFAALWVIWAVWFSAPEDRRLDRERIGRAIYSAPSLQPHGGDPHARP